MAAWGVFADALEIRAGRKKTPSRGHSSAINVIYRHQKGGGVVPLYDIFGNN